MQKKASNPDIDKDVSMKSGLEGRNNDGARPWTNKLSELSQ